MKVEAKSIDEIKPYENNPRDNDDAVDAVANSIKEFGWQQPIVVDKDMVIIVGHTRYKAAKKLGMDKVPVVVASKLTPEQVKAYRLADNKVGELADWDFEKLDEELDGINDIDMTDFGFDELAEPDELEDTDSSDAQEDDFDEEPPEEPKSKPGQMFQLGRHRLMCGDSTNANDVKKLMGGTKADLVFTDPPYGMKKQKDGVDNDNLNYDDLLKFNKKWVPITFENLKSNGSWYCWGNDEPLMDIYSDILKPMIKADKATFRNLITWDKGNGQSQKKETNKCYARADEKCLFVMAGAQGFSDKSEFYFKKFDAIRLYLLNEAKRVGLTGTKLKEITGVGMWSHWFTKAEWALMPQHYYQELQDYYVEENGFEREYSDIEREYEQIKEKFNDTRPYFDNTHDNMNDVWHFDRVMGKDREETGGHATPKPVELCARAIKSSSRKGESVLDVFGGSGSTLIACEQLERTAFLMELEPKWVDVIIDRWENLTGEKAKLIQK